MKECILAIDAGGTFFKYALISLNGELLTEVYKIPVNSGGTAKEILGCYHKLIVHARSLSDGITGIGISTPGPFDYESGTGYMQQKFKALYGQPLRPKLTEFFGRQLPIWFCPDTGAFLAGEYAYGAGKGYRNVIGITIGTGVGIAVIADGKLLMNEKKGPAEKIYCIPCKDGILEDYVSGRGIADYYFRLTGLQETQITAKEIHERAGKDEQARRTFEEIGDLLGSALKQVVKKYQTQAVIVGGQVANAFAYMEKGIIRGLDGAACVVLKAEDIDAAAIQGVLELKHRYFVMEGKG